MLLIEGLIWSSICAIDMIVGVLLEAAYVIHFSLLMVLMLMFVCLLEGKLGSFAI